MLQKKTKVLVLAFMAAALAIAAGCSKQAPDTKPPVSGAIGIIDMAKVIKNHPKYAELDRLNKQLNTLGAQLEARSSSPQAANMNAGAPGGAGQGLSTALEQEFNTKMAQKQAEIEQKLNVQADQVRSELSAAMQTYAAQVDQEYQPRIFSLQLKLKTVQLSKEEAEKLQKEVEGLQTERNSKLAAKEQELAAQLQVRMRPAQQAAEQEMAAYAQQLNADSQAEFAKKLAELAARTGQAPAIDSAAADLEQQAKMKQQEITALEEYIIKDIRDKAAKIAAEKKLDAVLANVRMNIQAVDISDAVIAEFKK